MLKIYNYSNMLKIIKELNSFIQMTHYRTHSTLSPILKLTYNNNKKNNNFKPFGLWYSFNEEWNFFIEKENYYFYDIKINKNKFTCEISRDITHKDKILKLETFEDYILFNTIFKSFGESWETLTYYYSGIEFINVKKSLNDIMVIHGFKNIFEALSKNYIFGSQVYEKYSWINTLDIDSGCIWNPEVISKIKLYKEPEN